MAITRTDDEIKLGRGRLYLEEGTDGALEYVGDVEALTVTVATEKAESFSSTGPTSEKNASAVIRVNRTGAMTVKNASLENLARFLGGAIETVSQTATPVTEESIAGAAALVADRIYRLGRLGTDPIGARNVSSVTIKYASGASTADLGTDYELDTARGIIRVIAGGALDGTSGVTADYTPEANSRRRVKTSDDVATTAKLHFHADNTTGENDDLFAPNCQINPTGDLGFISQDTFQSFGFELEFLPGDAGEEALYIDGVPVASS